jgi:hypothetical protein
MLKSSQNVHGMLCVGIPLCAAAATQMPRLVILDPDLIADIYGKKARHYKKPDFMTSFLDPLLGKGLVTSEGALWKQQRHVINPAFTGANIDKMLPLMVAATQACEKMQSLVRHQNNCQKCQYQYVTSLVNLTTHSNFLSGRVTFIVFASFQNHM